MKKLFAIAVAALMLVAVAVPALADSFRASDDPVTLTVMKADPSNVVKDGVIGEGEYVRFEVDTDEETSPLNVCFWTGNDLDPAMEMMATMEYYFSWDEVHGFNFAIRNKPHVLKQVIPEGTGDPPQDAFLHNVGYTFIADKQPGLKKLSDTMFYYAVAKDTESGAYKEGHYNQLGLKGFYNPVEGVEYCITYDYSTGYSMIEWSVPFDNFVEGAPAEGTVFYFSVGAEAGEGNTQESDSGYAVALGDWSWLVGAKSSRSHVTATLSDEIIPGPGEQSSESDETSGETTAAPVEDTSEDTGADDPTGPADNQTDPRESDENGDVITDDAGDTDPVGRDDTDPAGDGDTDPAGDEDTDPAADADVTDPADDTDPAVDAGSEGDTGDADGKVDPDAKSDDGNGGDDAKADADDKSADGSAPEKSAGSGVKTPATGDPMIVLAAVAAVSAAGAVVAAKKRK